MSTQIPKEAIDKLLKSLDVQMNEDHKAAFVEHLNEQLQERVGLAIADLLDEDELDEYIKISDSGNKEATQRFIAEYLPDIQDIISDELDILLGDIAESSDDLNG